MILNCIVEDINRQ